MDKLLTPKEAGRIIKRTPARIYQLIKEGELEEERFKQGKATRIRLRQSVVEAYKQRISIPDAMPSP